MSYADIVKFAGGVPVAVPCFEQAGFKLRAEDLEAAITPRTKWLVLDFPNNPTGAACSRADMAAIAAGDAAPSACLDPDSTISTSIWSMTTSSSAPSPRWNPDFTTGC